MSQLKRALLPQYVADDPGQHHEEGLRIPFIVRYPKLFPKGKLIDEMVANLDLAPTWLDLAGLPVHPGMHGASFKIQVSDNLTNWTDIPSSDPRTTTPIFELVFTTPKDTARKFCRLVVTP